MKATAFHILSAYRRLKNVTFQRACGQPYPLPASDAYRKQKGDGCRAKVIIII